MAIFPATDPKLKTDDAAEAINPENLVCRTVRAIKQEVGDSLGVICDVALDPYSSHGQDGLVRDDYVINDETISVLQKQAEVQAAAGCDIIAPSDMMDGRIRSIKQGLREAALGDTPVMSYSAKFASCFYGPFREAAHSIPTFGDRHAYQLPVAARGLALRAIDRDIAEGADFVMVKPAGPYLDIIRETRNRVNVPVACYQVSGECAMIHHAAAAGSFELRTAVHESIDAFRRAGADVFITYFAPDLLRWKR